jgi:hypothetical protein
VRPLASECRIARQGGERLQRSFSRGVTAKRMAYTTAHEVVKRQRSCRTFIDGELSDDRGSSLRSDGPEIPDFFVNDMPVDDD